MHYVSTRNPQHKVSLSEAIAQGIAPDGGLFVPEQFPHFGPHQFEDLHTLPEIAERLIAPFAADDPVLGKDLGSLCRAAFDFPVPLKPIPEAPAPAWVLE